MRTLQSHKDTPTPRLSILAMYRAQKQMPPSISPGGKRHEGRNPALAILRLPTGYHATRT